jgi:hypothetical protein
LAATSIGTATAFSCTTPFTRLSSPNPGHAYNNLAHVDAISESQAWAVGYQRKKQSGPDHTLIEHFSNGTWKAVGSPNASQGTTELYGVAVASNKSIFAVGENYHGSFLGSIIEHRTPKGTTLMKSPQPGSGSGLNGVEAISPTDVWAVGWSRQGGVYSTLAEHWDGVKWSKVAVPSPSATNSNLFGVSAVSSTDIWAVGYEEEAGVHKTLTLHYNGGSWSVVASPDVGVIDNQLQSVSVVSTGNVMAVGYQENGGFFATLALRWNGANWAVVPTTNPGISENNLQDVSMASATEGYAVGESDNGHTLMEYWNGATWSTMATPNPGTDYNSLGGVIAMPSGFRWAVGDEGSPFHTMTLVSCT